VREGVQPSLRVDGGMAANDYAMQFLSDIIGAPVDRPQVLETTALGAAWLAGQRAGVWPGMAEFAKEWAIERQFTAQMPPETRTTRYAAWRQAVKAVLAV
jgi:glycerol kinase